MRLLHHPAQKDIVLSGVLYALGDPVRLEVVKRLATEGEMSCSALCGEIAKSTLSHHIRILRESGVIRCRKEGTQQLNSLRREDLETLFPGLLDAVLQSCPISKSGVDIS